MVPAAFVLSAVLLAGEWAAITRFPKVTIIAFYLHTIVFGSVLTSGFWSLINERFDPHTAKKLVGRIAGGGFIRERGSRDPIPASVPDVGGPRSREHCPRRALSGRPAQDGNQSKAEARHVVGEERKPQERIEHAPSKEYAFAFHIRGSAIPRGRVG